MEMEGDAAQGQRERVVVHCREILLFATALAGDTVLSFSCIFSHNEIPCATV